MNMARRFRMALRPAKPKPPSVSSPAPNASMTKIYGNIQPRRPIHKDDVPTPVHPRPTLQVLRLAHQEANRAVDKTAVDNADVNNTDVDKTATEWVDQQTATLKRNFCLAPNFEYLVLQIIFPPWIIIIFYNFRIFFLTFVRFVNIFEFFNYFFAALSSILFSVAPI